MTRRVVSMPTRVLGVAERSGKKGKWRSKKGEGSDDSNGRDKPREWDLGVDKGFEPALRKPQPSTIPGSGYNAIPPQSLPRLGVGIILIISVPFLHGATPAGVNLRFVA